MTYSEKGQTVVVLMVFMVVATTIITAAVMMTIVNTQSTSRQEQAATSLAIANSGGENAMLRLLRDTSYTGETLQIDGGTATVTVTGTNPKTVTSIGRFGDSIKTIQITATGSGFLTVSSWKEIQ